MPQFDAVDDQLPALAHRQPSMLQSMSASYDAARQHLDSRGFIQFHPLLAKHLDNVKAAIFFGHALYWTRHQFKHNPEREGWFYMKAEDWQAATGLSPKEQVDVRKALIKADLMSEVLAGTHATMHFKVNLAATCKTLGLDTPTWDNLAQLFKPSIAFYKPLADITSKVTTGLYLSYLLQRLHHSLLTGEVNDFGYFTVSLDHVRTALCLTEKVQRNVRDHLKRAGLIQEVLTKETRPRLSVKLNVEAIMACLSGQSIRSLPAKHAAKAKLPKFSRAPGQDGQERQDVQTVRVKSATLAPGPTARARPSLFTPLLSNDSAQAQRQVEMFGVNLLGGVTTKPPRGGFASMDDRNRVANTALVLMNSAVFRASDRTDDAAGSHPVPPLTDETQGQAESYPQPVALLSKLNAKPVALLSKLTRPFVETDLPFCRN